MKGHEDCCHGKGQEEDCCGEERHECCEESECQGSHYNSGDLMIDGVLEIADEAWAELMKEKMKKHFEATMGKKMDEMAKAAVEASLIFWKNKMKGSDELKAAYKKLHDIHEKMGKE